MGNSISQTTVSLSKSVGLYGSDIVHITNEDVGTTLDDKEYHNRYHPTIKNEIVEILKKVKETDEFVHFLTYGKHIYGVIGKNEWGIECELVLSDLVLINWSPLTSTYYIEKKYV